MDDGANRPEPAWEDDARAAGPCVPIMRPKSGQSLTGLILCERLIGCWTHWTPRGETACLASHDRAGNPTRCADCAAGYQRQWAGYLTIWRPERRQYAVYQVSSYTTRCCPRLADPAVNLRGLPVSVQRGRRSDNGPLVAVLGSDRQLEGLPPDFSCRHLLLAKWGLGPVLLGDDQPGRPPLEGGATLPLPNRDTRGAPAGPRPPRRKKGGLA